MAQEVVFVHKIPVGGLSKQSAQQTIATYMENFGIDLNYAKTHNIMIPVKTEEASVECIYSSETEINDLVIDPIYEAHKPKMKSDVLIEYFIAKSNYDAYINEKDINYGLEKDLIKTKYSITDQIYVKEFYQIVDKLGVDEGEPVGICGPSKNNKAITVIYLNFKTKF